ncbi:hypothetical protein [Sphingomicrobium aestuariivivum]|uniref:hypothetical protein n=1 Tax=Sphingomicrobium aestuariivivum TaxID=1582356 RepID=UPI001FD709DB|nr:hypothetical protein [Sphingomicrobium aestuariivivum]MCJ8189913.1 hypothetical protein [Sphingomicrobium aestuariivivum]
MSVDPELIDAKNAVEAKRAQLMHSVKYTVGEAKRRLAPDLLAEQAWEKVKRKSSDTAHSAYLEAKAKPWLVGGIAAAIGLFLARKPVGEMAVKAYQSARGEEEAPAAATLGETPGAKPPPRRKRRSPAKAPSIAEFQEATKPIEDKKKPEKKAPKATKGRSKDKKTEDV